MNRVFRIRDTIKAAAANVQNLISSGIYSKIADAIEFLYPNRTLAFKNKVLDKCEDTLVNKINKLNKH